MDSSDFQGSSERFRRGTVLFLTVGISVLFLYMIRGFLLPLFMAAIFSGSCRPIYLRLLKRLGGRRVLASIVTLVGLLVLVIVPLLWLIGLVATEALRVSENALPWIESWLEEPAIERVESRLADRFPVLEEHLPSREDIIAALGKLATEAGNFLLLRLSAMTSGAAAFFLHLFVMLYAMFFFLMDGPRLVDRIAGMLPLEAEEKQRVLSRFLSVTRATLKGSVIIGLIQGALGGITFAVVGIHGAAFWGAVMVVLSIIPGIGTAVVWVPAVVFFFIEGEPTKAVVLAAWFAGVVGSVDNILRPTLVGKDAELSDLMILVGTLGGIFLFGVVGFVAGPIVCALFVTIWDIYGMTFRDELERKDEAG